MGFGAWVIPVSIFYRRVTGLRRGLAVGAFFGSFRTVSCTLFRLLDQSSKTSGNWHDIISRFVNAISGFVSGAIFSLIDKDVKSSIFVLWIAIRAIRVLLPPVLYADVVLMMLSASSILSTYVHAPGDNTPSYASFLHKFGDKSTAQLSKHRGDALHEIPMCDLIHPNQSCIPHFITFTANGLIRAVPLYVPVHLAGLLLSSNRSLIQFGHNVFRSSLFLSVYCSTAWLSACYFYRYVAPRVGITQSSRVATLIPELLPGLAVLLERPSRRRELVTYCLSHALNSNWNWAQRAYGLRSRSWVSVLALAFSFGVLLQHFEQQPNAITFHFFGIHEYPIVIGNGRNIRFSPYDSAGLK